MSLLKELFESGAHFGHQKKFWNPNMMPYIFGEKNGIHIINLDKTLEKLTEAEKLFFNLGATSSKVLFVGTKRIATEPVFNTAKQLKQPFVIRRWLGGTLTNYKTIKSSIKRLENLCYQRDNGVFDKMTKKEALLQNREIADLEYSIGGIKNMTNLPDIIFLSDPLVEHIALKEAQKLKIPVVAISDTNADPTSFVYSIPANDDSAQTLQIILGRLAAAYENGAKTAVANPVKKEEKNGN